MIVLTAGASTSKQVKSVIMVGLRRKFGASAAASVVVDEELFTQLHERAEAGGLKLAAEGGLLAELARSVLESVFESEMVDHLGYENMESLGTDRIGRVAVVALRPFE